MATIQDMESDFKRLNLYIPVATNRLLDRARRSGRGHFSPTVGRAIFCFYELLSAEQREESEKQYDEWLKQNSQANEHVAQVGSLERKRTRKKKKGA